MLVVGLAAIACSGSRQPQVIGSGDGRGAIEAAAGAAAVDAAPDTRTDAAIDAPTVTVMADDAIASTLVRGAGGEPVLLVERGGAIVATTPSGKLNRTLAKAPTRRAQYAPSWWLVWFIRGDQLRVIDLTRTAVDEVAVVDAMPDLEPAIDSLSKVDKEYCPSGCVAIRSSATPALAVVEPTEGPASQAEIDAARRALTTAPPRLTAAGRAFFVELARRPGSVLPNRPAQPTASVVSLSDARWPGPPSTRKHPTCAYDTCGRTFAIPGLARSLIVVGRKCDCSVDACWSMCVWLDTQQGRYASMRAPGRWAADVAAEPACHPEFDASGAAYVIGGWVSPGALAVCTAASCRREPGRFLHWLESGVTTENTSEDLSTCPE